MVKHGVFMSSSFFDMSCGEIFHFHIFFEAAPEDQDAAYQKAAKVPTKRLPGQVLKPG